jgi:two-component system, chemotaxis family, chemotaxis protein CheY
VDTILTVDDSPSMRRMVAETLKNAGYEVISAEHGQAAVAVARDNDVQLVITDINMPVMDGVELVRSLRAMQKYSSTPILALTTERDDVKQAVKDAGATGWIAKPFNPDKLIALIDKFLR